MLSTRGSCTGRFTAEQSLDGGGWTVPVIIVAILSALYFISTLVVLILGLKPPGAVKQQQLKKTLTVQGVLVFLLFVFSPESAGVFAALCLSRVRNYYRLKTALTILLLTFVTLAASIAYYYGNYLGPVGLVIVTILAAGFYSFTL